MYLLAPESIIHGAPSRDYMLENNNKATTTMEKKLHRTKTTTQSTPFLAKNLFAFAIIESSNKVKEYPNSWKLNSSITMAFHEFWHSSNTEIDPKTIVNNSII